MTGGTSAMRRLSIGVFTYSTRPRGSVVHAGHLAEALADAGHAATLYALSKNGDAFYRPLRCPVVLLPTRPAPSDPEALVRQRVDEVAEAVVGLRPMHDVYHAEDCLAGSGLLRARRMLGYFPVVRTVHHVEAYASTFLAACQLRSVVQADAVLAVSRVGARDVFAAFGRRAPVVSNGVDSSRFRGAHADIANLRAPFERGPDDRVVLSVGGVEERKNSLNALAGMVPLLSDVPELHWVIAGGASIWEHARYRETFETRIAELPASLRCRIHVLGPVSEVDLTALYLTSDVLLCPSLQEGFGLSVLEACAAGLAVVVSMGEPFTEYLDADSASFVDPHSPATITRAVTELVRHPGLRARRRAAARAVALRFPWSSVAIVHVDHYTRLLTPLVEGEMDPCPRCTFT